jgi:hypothetical protein
LAIGGVEKVWRVRGHAPDEYAKNPAARVLRRRRKVHTHTYTHSGQDAARRVRHQGSGRAHTRLRLLNLPAHILYFNITAH